MSRWLTRLGHTVKGWRQLASAKNHSVISHTLWQDTLGQYPFLAQRSAADLEKLRTFAELFLRQKEFHGTQGLAISDHMAVAIAAQACLPILHWGAPRQALAWYGDPDAMLARREMVDEAGVVHRYTEPLAGEAMDGGPVTLNWKDVANAGAQAVQGMNLVIHEFAHKIDMQSGGADGCPPLPPGFLGTASASAARRQWLAVMVPAYDSFREATILAERFGAAPTWLDPYGATSLSEFFAVACEAYFVNRRRFGEEFAPLAEMLDTYFNPAAFTASSRGR
jgi:MtfA peptidase